MKKLKIAIVAACIVALITTASAKKLPPGTSWRFIRTIPIVLEPTIGVTVPWFWAALAATGVLVDVMEELCEPLDHYEVGIQHCVRATSAEISYPDLEYPTRTIDAEAVYDFNIITRQGHWFGKTTFTVYLLDSGPVVEVIYSTEPPAVQTFEIVDVHYNRIGLSGAHQSSFSYDAFEVVTAYCVRRGSKAWGRPVMAIISGWNWAPKWQNDILYHNPTTPYEDRHYLMIGPGGFALYKPKDGEPNAEINSTGVATFYFTP